MTWETLATALTPRIESEWIGEPDRETFVTVKLRGGGAVRRTIGEGKTPRPFRGSRIRGGDLIYSRIDARNGAFAIVTPELDGAVVSKDFPTFGVNVDRLEPAYLAHLVRAGGFWARFQAMSFGATNRQRIDERLLLAQEVYLPPLPEQRRIATILDEAEGLRTAAFQQLSLIDLTVQAAFAELLNKTHSGPTTIDALIQSSQYGTSQKAGAEGDVPVLRMGNITYDGRIDLTDMKYLDLPSSDESKYLVHAGDVLFNRTNSAELVGKTAVYREPEPRAYAGYLVRLRPRSPELGEYIAGYLNSAVGKLTLRKMAKSIVGMANINAKEVRSIRLPVPDPTALAWFTELRRHADAERPRLVSRSEEFDALFASLQHRAFRGEL